METIGRIRNPVCNLWKPNTVLSDVWTLPIVAISKDKNIDLNRPSEFLCCGHLVGS